jgi:hypothetical protein
MDLDSRGLSRHLSPYTPISSVNNKSLWPVVESSLLPISLEEAEKANVYRCFQCFTSLRIAFKVIAFFLIKLLTGNKEEAHICYRFCSKGRSESFSFRHA